MVEKSTVTRHGDKLNFGLMFTKVDKENRVVSGFATLDNVDDHGDIVAANASRSAFARFRGGLREMHQPNAVGTLVSFEDTKLYVRNTDSVHDGIYVHAKVSKGAEDTWQKVLDGTLKGFSIGGKVNHKSLQMADDGQEHLVIEDYDLIELSLVDNPANPLANVMTVQKIGDSFVYSDDEVMEKQVLNILLHESGDVILSEDAERDGFENIGWTDSVDNTEKIRLAIHEHETSVATAGADEPEVAETDEISASISHDNDNDVILRGAQTTDEGGATVTTDINKTADETDEVADDVTEVDETEGVEKAADVTESDDADDADDTDDTEVAKAADIAEVDSEPAVDEDELVAKVTAAVADVLAKATDAAKESSDAVADVKSSFDKSVDEFDGKLDEKISELKKSFEDELKSLAKRVDEIDSETAVKKSADIVDDNDDAEEDEGEDNIWRGSFLGANSLTKA